MSNELPETQPMRQSQKCEHTESSTVYMGKKYLQECRYACDWVEEKTLKHLEKVKRCDINVEYLTLSPEPLVFGAAVIQWTNKTGKCVYS